MDGPDHDAPAGERIARWLPTALLLAVAAGQLLLTHWAGLTPWLGGGFAMFGSTDASNARAIVARGASQRGAIYRLYVPLAGEHKVDPRSLRLSLRAMPTAERKRRFAARLLELEWTPVTLAEVAGHAGFIEVAGRLPADAIELPMLRPVTATDALSAHREALRLRGIELEVWKIRYDLAAETMRAERFGPPVTVGVWR